MALSCYPLKFKSIFKEKIWGGEKIRTILGKDFSHLPNCGESWELSGLEGNVSEIANGQFEGEALSEVIEQCGADLLGGRIIRRFGHNFPLLIKFIDAHEDLSVQVHPDDHLAGERYGANGKSEMWYVVQADERSSLMAGLIDKFDESKYREVHAHGQVESIVNRHLVSEGDVFYVPAGMVHSIGAGMLIAEIQQASDITYRLYDFDRKNEEGILRELHLETGLGAIDFDHNLSDCRVVYDHKINSRIELVNCEHFVTSKLHLTSSFEVDYKNLDCFKTYICLQGQCNILGQKLTKGEVMLVPAVSEQYEIEVLSETILLESYIAK